MKKYIGKKSIMASPMSKSDAERVLNRKLSESKGGEEGYLVEYEDGYRSWSPKETFEAAYKMAETHLDRHIKEMEKLKEVLNNALELTPYERGVLIDELSKSEELKRRDKVVDAFSKLSLVLNMSNFKSAFLPNMEYQNMRNKMYGKSPVSEEEFADFKSALKQLQEVVNYSYLKL